MNQDMLGKVQEKIDRGTLSSEEASGFLITSIISIANKMDEQTNKIEKQSEKIEHLVREMEKINSHVRTNPSLMWLLRFRTKETIAFIVLLFVILSIWWVSGIRQPILNWLGLPVF